MRKTNNKGFTMTEVIVAVAVFLILAVPILSQLVISVKNNSKAKSSQYGINVAESEMELFKSVDLNNLAKIYVKTDKTVDGKLVTEYSIPDACAIKDGTGKITGVNEDEFMKSTYATPALLEFAKKYPSFSQDEKGICTFTSSQTLSNADTASAENETNKSFEVVVTLDPEFYTDSTNGVAGTYNSKRDGAVQNLNKDLQAIIGSDLSVKDQMARDQFWNYVLNDTPDGVRLNAQEYQMYNTPAKNIPSRFRVGTFWMHRTTYITIEANNDSAYSSLGRYVVTYRYSYEGKMQIGSQWYEHNVPFDETKLYFNTVPDVKFYYNQFVVSRLGNATQQSSDVIFDDSIEFTNKLDYEKKTADGNAGSGYEYYYTNSDLYLVANLSSSRGYSPSKKCTISLGPQHNPTQNEIKVYYSETITDKSIKDNLRVDPVNNGEITIEDAAKKVVQQEFQPIYDIKVKVSPSNGKGLTTNLEGTRGQ